jgi:hypothetical protein
MATQPPSLFAVARNSFRVLWKASRELFHEVTGTLFFLIAVSTVKNDPRTILRAKRITIPPKNKTTIVIGSMFALLSPLREEVRTIIYLKKLTLASTEIEERNKPAIYGSCRAAIWDRSRLRDRPE